MPRAKSVRPKEISPPTGFEIDRSAAIGRHPLLEVFPGADRLPIAGKVEPDARGRARLFRATEIELVDQDMWMYVAPRELPKIFGRQWKPVVSRDKDCIVIGAPHLRASPGLTLYMDIYHELRHVCQRRDGADLWPPGVSYVRRWTEIDAYRIVVDDARRLGASDEFLREYLKVEWIDPAEYRELLKTLGVPPA